MPTLLAIWTRVARWWVWGAVGVLAAGLGVLAQANDTYSRVEPFVPPSRQMVQDQVAAVQIQLAAVVDQSVSRAASEVSAKIDVLGAAVNAQGLMLALQRIQTDRISLAQMRAARPGLEALLAANPTSDILKSQLEQLDKDIIDADRSWRVGVCDFNKRTILGFTC